MGWPQIRSGRHTLISAPTGTGKTIAGYLSAIDNLARQSASLRDETHVLYISPLRALSKCAPREDVPLVATAAFRNAIVVKGGALSCGHAGLAARAGSK